MNPQRRNELNPEIIEDYSERYIERNTRGTNSRVCAGCWRMCRQYVVLRDVCCSRVARIRPLKFLNPKKLWKILNKKLKHRQIRR